MGATCMTESDFEALMGKRRATAPSATLQRQLPGPGPGTGHCEAIRRGLCTLCHVDGLANTSGRTINPVPRVPPSLDTLGWSVA